MKNITKAKKRKKSLWRKLFFNRQTFFSILVIMITIFTFARVKAVEKKVIQYKKVTVKPGDTLWNLSMKYKDKSEDIRDYICHIQQLNEIHVTIHPGDVLIFPIN